MSQYLPQSTETLLNLLAVRPGDRTGRFVGNRKPGGLGRVYGGQVVAQALAAAERTVGEAFSPHSLHAYFLRGGDEDHEIDFAVEADFDGRSFANRRVIASQLGTPILNLTVSFQIDEQGFSHQQGMPDVPPPEGLMTEVEFHRQNLHRFPEKIARFLERPAMIEFRPVQAGAWLDPLPAPGQLSQWFRTTAPMPDDMRQHRAVLAWVSDYALLATSAAMHGVHLLDGQIVAASLDHAIWFHEREFRTDEWLLHTTDSPWAGHGRGFGRGRVYTRDGLLIAETAQEGLMRPRTRPSTVWPPKP